MVRRLIVIALLLIPFAALSDELRQAYVTYHMDVEVLNTSYPHTMWMGSGPIRYRWENGEGRIVGGDIPQMTQRCPVDVPGYKQVMLVIRGQVGSVGVVKVNEGEVTVSGVAMELEVAEGFPSVGILASPLKEVRPMLHMIFPDLTMTSNQIFVNGKSYQGKVDIDTMSAELVFSTTIPPTGNRELDEAISGKTVVGRFRIALQNPYQKE